MKKKDFKFKNEVLYDVYANICAIHRIISLRDIKDDPEMEIMKRLAERTIEDMKSIHQGCFFVC